MEILLIGNGFDLKHKLPTSYSDFLKFCEIANKIYTYELNTSAELFKRSVLDKWETSDCIKQILLEAFKTRHIDKSDIKEYFHDYGVRTSNKELDELHSYIKNNVWLKYFTNHSNITGENWIDFESEISRVIQALDAASFQIVNNRSANNINSSLKDALKSILDITGLSIKDINKSIALIKLLTVTLNSDLDRLIRALEIYIAGFVEKIPIEEKSVDIEKLNPDHVLSFNYSNTYERVYGNGKDIEYDYIHGKADINKNVETCNLVLGIDEYLDDNRKNEEFTFLTFKKYYQRIYKSTGNRYLNWVDEIKDGYDNYVIKVNNTNARIVQSFKDGSFDKYPYEIHECKELLNEEYPQHTLYIFGHSLDITDRDVLRLFICNENVQTKIYYHRKNQDDKKSLGEIITNLIRIMGQDELIRRTGGTHKTIEFIPQTVH